MRTEKQKISKLLNERRRKAERKTVCQCGNLKEPESHACHRCSSIENLTNYMRGR